MVARMESTVPRRACCDRRINERHRDDCPEWLTFVAMDRDKREAHAESAEELRAFFVVVYRALRMICSYLERRYGL